MAINKKLITFKTRSVFDGSQGINGKTTATDGYYGNIPAYSIVFIKDTGEIWHNGSYYGAEITNNKLKSALDAVIASQVTGSTYGFVYKVGSEDYRFRKLNLWGHDIILDSSDTYKGDLKVNDTWIFGGAANGYIKNVNNTNALTFDSSGNVTATGTLKASYLSDTFVRISSQVSRKVSLNTINLLNKYSTSGGEINSTNHAIIDIAPKNETGGFEPWIAGANTDKYTWAIGLDNSAGIGITATANTSTGKYTRYWKFDKDGNFGKVENDVFKKYITEADVAENYITPTSTGMIIPLEENGSTTAGNWLAKSSLVTSLEDGRLYLYRIAVAGASTTYLTINSLTKTTIYRTGTTKLTTHYAVGEWLLLVYNATKGAFYVVNDYDANSYAYVRQYLTATTDTNTYPLLFMYDTSRASSGSYVTKYSRYADAIYVAPSTGAIYANKYIVTNGTSSQFLKADGSVDSTAYLPLSGGTMSGTITFPKNYGVSWGNGNTVTEEGDTIPLGLSIWNNVGRNDCGGPSNYSVILNIRGYYTMQLANYGGSGSWRYYIKNSKDTEWAELYHSINSYVSGKTIKIGRNSTTWTDTWKAASSSQEGYVPKLVTGGTAISTQSTEYVLTYVSSGTGTVYPVWKLLPANAFKNDNTWTQLVGATASANGTAGYAPQPLKADITHYLKGDGTWAQVAYSEISGTPSTLKNPNTITIQLNGGSTEGTSKFTYDGSAVKSLNISPSTIGAQAADFTSSYTASLTPTTSWSDVGTISSIFSGISTGTYVIQMYCPNHKEGSTQRYSAYYSGVFTWLSSTNSTASEDEIPLHMSAHASHIRLFLRTINQTNSSPKLQIAASATFAEACSIQFKIRKLI